MRYTIPIDECETRRFTDDEVKEAHEIGQLRYSRAGGRNRHDFNHDPVAANGVGLLGEWAVADSLGYPRPKHATGKSDGGIDLVLEDGTTIDVRFAKMRDGGFLTPKAKGVSARYGVLTTRGPDYPREIVILGGFGLLEFELVREEIPYIPGPASWIVWQKELIPWARLRDVWAREPVSVGA